MAEQLGLDDESVVLNVFIKEYEEFDVSKPHQYLAYLGTAWFIRRSSVFNFPVSYL